MHTSLPTNLFASARYKLFAAVLLPLLFAGSALNAQAQGQAPSGTISGAGSGPYTYNLSFSDGGSATSPIGSIWYAWSLVYPPFFYLPSAPTGASAPAGWSAAVDGNSIRFSASSSIYDIQPGYSLSGFSYTASFTPAQLSTTIYSGVSVAYSGAIQTSPDTSGVLFTVSTVPEPGTLGLMGFGAGALAMLRRRQSR